jgi:predicted O-linked N-acetylglucosamine transferase (SPINDLY family)
MTATAQQAASAATPEAEKALFEAFWHHQEGRLEAAVGRYRDAIAIHPDFPEALNNLGIALKDQHRFAEAVTEYRKALALRPDFAQIWNNLGDSLHSLGDRTSAITHYRKALALLPDYAVAWRNLGDCLAETGEMDEAQECFGRALALDSSLDASFAPADMALGECQRQFAKMVTTIEAATARDPRLTEAYLACGRDERPPLGCDADTAERFRFATQLRTGFSDHLSSLLMHLHYDREFAPDILRNSAHEVESFHAQTPRFTDWPNLRDPERRLRIGYVSADFKKHSVGYFLSAIFLNHDAASIETTCYSGCTEEDEQTDFFRSRAAHWRSTIGIDDRELAAQIRADAIDILVDLSGHTFGHRLNVFARKPAPLQVTWLGYPNTTGLPAIDYRLTDSIADPQGAADTASSEELFRLPDGFHCYTAPVAAPDVSRLPAERNGFVTFGSFNNLAKVNHQVLDAWAGVLKEVAGSHLILKSTRLLDPEMRKRVLKLLEQRGIASDRVRLIGKLPTTADHLAVYGDIDIALDTFPYNGATTTCEALWMGVPVVTFAGDRHAGRVGASMLSRVGLQDIVAQRSQDYVATAARLAADLPALAVLRASLRDRLAASPLCDGPRFTRQLEAAYRTMWREWCAAGR